MSNKRRQTTIGLLIIFATLITIDSFVVIRFFTNDKIDKVTLSNASLNNSEEIISTNIANQENPETFIIPNYTKTANVKKISTTSRASTKRNTTTQTSSNNKINTKKSNKSNSKLTNKNNKSTTQKTNTNNTKNQETVGTIVIPKTNVNLPIYKNITVSNMETATCLLYSNGALNKSGTTVIIGHNYKNGKLFSNNNKLKIGDTIYVTTTDNKKIKYTIYDKFTTTEDDITYLKKNTTGKAQIALSTCTNNGKNRLVILAK